MSEKWFYVSGMTDNVTLTLTSITGDAAIMPAEYSTGVPFKGILFKLDKRGDKLVSPKSAALGGKNFIVLTHSGAATGTTTTTVPLTTVNPVYGTAEVTQTFNNDGVSQLKWGYLPLTVLTELSAVDQGSFESWVAMTIEKMIFDNTTKVLLFDNFNRSNVNPLTGTNLSVQYSGGFPSTNRWQISSNVASSFNSTDASTLWVTGLSLKSADFEHYFRYKQTYSSGSGASNSYIRIGSSESVGATTLAFNNGSGLVISTSTDANAGNVYMDGVLKGALDMPVSGTDYAYRVRRKGAMFFIKRWASASSEPTAWTLTFTHSSQQIAGDAMYFYSGNSNGANYTVNLDDLTLSSFGNGIVLRGSTAITGTANKLSRKTTIYSFSRANSIPAELGGAVYAE